MGKFYGPLSTSPLDTSGDTIWFNCAALSKEGGWISKSPLYFVKNATIDNGICRL